MNSIDDEVQLAASHDPTVVREAALIWARASALRDLRPAPVTGEEKISGIQRRLTVAGAKLVLAKQGDAYVGFTLFAPLNEYLEIFYLAVDPASWGRGVASTLLVGAEDYARTVGMAALGLWVIADNDRALSVYERQGFLGTEQMKFDESSGRIERWLLKDI